MALRYNLQHHWQCLLLMFGRIMSIIEDRIRGKARQILQELKGYWRRSGMGCHMRKSIAVVPVSGAGSRRFVTMRGIITLMCKGISFFFLEYASG